MIKIINERKHQSIGTNLSKQTVQRLIRLLLKKQSDQGLRCLQIGHIVLLYIVHHPIVISNWGAVSYPSEKGSQNKTH